MEADSITYQKGAIKMLGGGIFNSQNKKFPGSYINIESGIKQQNYIPYQEQNTGWLSDVRREISEARGGEKDLVTRLEKILNAIPPFSTHEQVREGSDDATVMTPVKVLTSIKSNIEGLTNIELENICK